jgi:hypothetical protein
MNVKFTLVAEGAADAALLPILAWTIRSDARVQEIDAQFAHQHLLPPPRQGLEARIRKAAELFPADLFIVHRDSDRAHPNDRAREIARAINASRLRNGVPVVPVRMSEAWLLIDEAALRSAAGNPRGTIPLPAFPSLGAIERIADPKALLHDLLRTASGLRGRRLAKFDERGSAKRVAERIDDYRPLRNLDAFARFERDLARALDAISER